MDEVLNDEMFLNFCIINNFLFMQTHIKSRPRAGTDFVVSCAGVSKQNLLHHLFLGVMWQVKENHGNLEDLN